MNNVLEYLKTELSFILDDRDELQNISGASLEWYIDIDFSEVNIASAYYITINYKGGMRSYSLEIEKELVKYLIRNEIIFYDYTDKTIIVYDVDFNKLVKVLKR